MKKIVVQGLGYVGLAMLAFAQMQKRIIDICIKWLELKKIFKGIANFKKNKLKSNSNKSR